MSEKRKYPRKWEQINCGTYRLKIPGGWLVSVSEDLSISDENSISVSVCFVPDPLSLWILEDVEQKKNELLETIDNMAGDVIALARPELDTDTDEHDLLYTKVHNALKESFYE